MAGTAKSPILILIVLILVSLFLAGAVFYLLQKEKANNLILQSQLTELKAQQKVNEAKLAESKKVISGLELKLQEAQAKIVALTHDFNKEKAAAQEAVGNAEKLKAEIEEQRKIRTDSEKKLAQAQEDMKKIQAQFKELDTKKTGLEAKIKGLETQLQQAQNQNRDVELGKIVVAPEGSAPAQRGADLAASYPAEKAQTYSSEGKVLVVNKDYNFVVINLGSKDGVSEGEIFAVYRNNKYIGDIKIDKIHDSMSAAGFLSADMKDKVSEGDKVTEKTK